MAETFDALPVSLHPLDNQPPRPPSAGSATLKRRASSTFEDRDESSVKRPRETYPVQDMGQEADEPVIISGQALADDLEEELMCGCCSALLYQPVIVYPCQHYFCGSCCVLWVRNGGTSCPACRAVSTSVSASRVLQLMIDILLRADPSRGRTDREKQQANEIYRPGEALRIPPPREVSPEPAIPPTGDFVRPCPHCSPGNRYGWTCPQPVPDPLPEQGWHIDDGSPPGHAYCGNCENLLALGAPATTRCDMCQVAFCGISVQGRCMATSLIQQHPHGLSDVGDLIQSADVYENFNGNAVEVDIMLDYVTAQQITPRHIYREIVDHIQSQPRKFAPLVELDLFADVHAVVPGAEVAIDHPRNRICRVCAAEVLLWGLKDWWGRERKKALLEGTTVARPDCPGGSDCPRQKEHAHAKEFNHIFSHHLDELPAPAAPEPADTNNVLAPASADRHSAEATHAEQLEASSLVDGPRRTPEEPSASASSLTAVFSFHIEHPPVASLASLRAAALDIGSSDDIHSAIDAIL